MDAALNLSLTGNGSLVSPVAMRCTRTLPHASVWLGSLNTSGIVLLVFLFLFCLITVVIYVEEVLFILKAFKIGFRKKKTIWVLSCFPMWSVLGLVAVCVPKAGPLIDMLSNMFFGTCLYNFGKLMVHYMGGAKGLWKVIGMERRIQTNTLPVCCCCLCLPKMHFLPMRYFVISMLIMQVTIIRPFLWFTAAVLYSNDAFIAGLISGRHSYVYIMIINIISTSTAVYALMLMRNAFRPELEKQFFIMGKFASVQLTLIIGSIPLIVVAILVGKGVIGCGPLMSPKGRADEIYHIMLVIIMLPLSLLGRKSFRRVQDGCEFAQRLAPPTDQQQQDQGDIVKTPLNGADDHVIVVPTSGSDANGNAETWISLPEAKTLAGKLDSSDESRV